MRTSNIVNLLRSTSLPASLSIYLNERARRFFVLGRVAGISLGFSTFILARDRPSTGPTFHREFSRYRARKVAKTCSRISFPFPPLNTREDRRPARFCTVRHARRIKLSSRKLAYYLPDRDNNPRSHGEVSFLLSSRRRRWSLMEKRSCCRSLYLFRDSSSFLFR